MKISIISKLFLKPISKSFSLCAGVTLRQPVPNSESTLLSPTIGTTLLTNGTINFFPTSFLYLLSLGFTATAVSPKIVSGLVVATNINSSELSSLYFK